MTDAVHFSNYWPVTIVSPFSPCEKQSNVESSGTFDFTLFAKEVNRLKVMKVIGSLE